MRASCSSRWTTLQSASSCSTPSFLARAMAELCSSSPGLVGSHAGRASGSPDADRHAPPTLHHRHRTYGSHRLAEPPSVPGGPGPPQAGPPHSLRPRTPTHHCRGRLGRSLLRSICSASGRAGPAPRGPVPFPAGTARLPAAPVLAGDRLRHTHSVCGELPGSVPLPDRTGLPWQTKLGRAALPRIGVATRLKCPARASVTG